MPVDVQSLDGVWDSVDEMLSRRELWLSGTVSRLKVTKGGWVFGELNAFADDQPGQASASLSFTIAGPARRNIEESLCLAGGRPLDVGMHGNFFGRLQSDRRYGKLQFLVSSIDASLEVAPVVTETERIVAALTAEGLLDRQQRLAVPRVPETIVLISSATAAGALDVETILESHPADMVRIHSPVSGPNAIGGVTKALSRVPSTASLVLIARGGGSVADLSVWDSPLIAQAIAGCPIPVWTALGHTGDRLLADLVSNRSWSTPTEAASALTGAHQSLKATEAAAVQRLVVETAADVRVSAADSRSRSLLIVLVGVVALLVVIVALVGWMVLL